MTVSGTNNHEPAVAPCAAPTAAPPSSGSTVALRCAELRAGYAGKAVVRGFDLSVRQGEVVALLGPNGAGKTTVMLTLAGLIPKLAGAVEINGRPMVRGGATAASREGLVLVPDDRALFTTLSVKENLLLGRRKGGPSIDDVAAFFPTLGRRLEVPAGMLSGGEQQMLAVGRAMMQRPKVLLIDELSMGLAPVVVQALLPVVRQVADETGAAVVLVEQHVHLALGIADQAIVMVHGGIVLQGSASELLSSPDRLEQAYLGG